MGPASIDIAVVSVNKFRVVSFQSSVQDSHKYLTCPTDTGRILNVHKTFRRRPRRLLNVLCTFNLRPVSTEIRPLVSVNLRQMKTSIT